MGGASPLGESGRRNSTTPLASRDPRFQVADLPREISRKRGPPATRLAHGVPFLRLQLLPCSHSTTAKSPSRPSPSSSHPAGGPPPAMATPAPHLVDEILEEIFLRVPTPAALGRASTACPRFRRIITERSFLRRFRKRTRPPLLGFIEEDGFYPAQAPHSSAPLARALADAADFTYSFVPKPSNGRWRPCDVRDGRVLLEDTPGWNEFSNLAVCDPLSRRHLLLPPIPEDLTGARKERLCGIVPTLAPIDEEDEDETSFKVICMAEYETKPLAFVFSSLRGNGV
ncbi:hypothetical protein QYE76_020169 [Lolium multiflorum]|uniref:F-box domain-containing protein n=1 Tax=Lolium multiflorum TaxID=4521 RepID=A0AAD8R6I2_LOLMU|nr:hypothetical protein QYE76_020169 [Lolium multiflorum]